MATVKESPASEVPVEEQPAKKAKERKQPKAKPLPGVWGIDIGQCALKAIRLELVGGEVTATAFDYVEYPKILSQPDADPDQLTREALEKFLSRNSLRGDLVVISVPGQSGLARFVKLPPVEEKKITDIVRFEAKQQIPFPLDEVVWDYQKIGSGVVTDGFAMETEIGLFAMKRDMVNRSLQAFKDVNVEVHVVQMSPLALCNFVAYDLLHKDGDAAAAADDDGDGKGPDFKKHCVVALDIGTDNSNLVITDGNRIIWQRPIPHGGNHFTRALTKELKLTFAKAEHVKRNATKSPDLKRILSALKPVLNDFVGEVQRSLGYFTNTHRDAQIDFVVGLGNAFRLPGLQKFLSEKLQIDVRKLQKMDRLTGDGVVTAPAFSQNIMSFAVAYGLALQGLNRTRLRTNLLPPDIRFERMIRAKKPWAVAAAAILLLGVAGLAWGYSRQYRAVGTEEIQKAIRESQAQLAAVNDQTQKVAQEENKVVRNEDTVLSMVSGQKERIDWLLLNRYVDDCLPVPGVLLEGVYNGPDPKGRGYRMTDRAGREHLLQFEDIKEITVLKGKPPSDIKGLEPGTEVELVIQPDPNAKPFWNDAALAAFHKYWDRLSGKAADAKSDEKNVGDLIHVSIEAMDARLCKDLGGFFNGLKARGDFKQMDMMPKDRDTIPGGTGWVVELRGYTYHNKGRKFLTETLVKNLATRGGPAGAAGAKSATPAADPAPAATESVPPEIRKDWSAVIQGRITHPILFKTHYDPAATYGPFKYQMISQTQLDSLEGLEGFNSLLGGGGGFGIRSRSGSSGQQPRRRRANVEREEQVQEKPPPTPVVRSADGRAALTRTEFVVLFMWKERF